MKNELGKMGKQLSVVGNQPGKAAGRRLGAVNHIKRRPRSSFPIPPFSYSPILTLLLLVLLVAPSSAYAQDSLDVTFRYLTDGLGQEPERVFVPGTFNSWGQPYLPNTSGCIMPGHRSQMEFERRARYWRHTVRLPIGRTVSYKMQLHLNDAGTNCAWLSDPLNPRIDVSDNNNSLLTVTDPMVFQLAQELAPSGNIRAVSASFAGSEALTAITFSVNGVDGGAGLAFYDAATGVFRFELDREVQAGAQFLITATDAIGRTITSDIGEILPPITWATSDYETVQETVALSANITRLDGSIDPTLTEATLRANGEESSTAVTNGEVTFDTPLALGSNVFQLVATVEGQTFTSDSLVVTRRLHPLDFQYTTASVGGVDRSFTISLSLTDLAPPGTAITWALDEANSTTIVSDVSMNGLRATATAENAGEVYFDVTATAPDGTETFQRIAVIVEEAGTARLMRYEENAAWTKKAVVYEIFPLTFGPEARGTASNPGTRFQEITAELDYIAQMGFNTIWFMPIMQNQFMDQLSGGYNITNFYRVDPKLGTNDDFKALVERAHELGIKIILDLTPSHVSPIHPWVQSLREGGPFADYIQTEPNPHNKGLDGRGANLPEIWQVEAGGNLYRKYDGFGDLANLNWDNDDLQAAMLDVIAFWVREFDIDGWRFDVYWGPWRRYGPDRFGRPIRDLMKRIKPDAWLLGENFGTGAGAEVYYADDDWGTRLAGGLDAAYDWNFYFNGVRRSYGNLGAYNAGVRNGDFWPGPNARYFRFLENHDEERIAHLMRAVPDRILPLTGMLLTVTGIPMVYHGQEVGFGDVSGDNRRVPVSWQTEQNGRFARYYQQLAHARTQFPAFGTQDFRTLNTSSGVYGFVRPYQDQNAVVLINFLGAALTIAVDPTGHVDVSHDGPIAYTDVFSDTTHVDTELDGFTVTIPAYETVVYITGDQVDFDLPPLPTLPYDAVYTSRQAEAELPQTLHLDQNYPNPFNPITTISYSLPVASEAQIEVLDVLGRRVQVLAQGFQTAGRHTVAFDATSLPSGTYFYRLQANGQVQVRTMVLVK